MKRLLDSLKFSVYILSILPICIALAICEAVEHKLDLKQHPDLAGFTD